MLSFACTIIRETFNTWTPVYLHDHLGYDASHAAGLSAIFPGVGAVSVLAAGWLSDRLGLNGRSLLMFLGLAGSAAALLMLMSVRSGAGGTFVPLLTIGVIAFCLLGPLFLPRRRLRTRLRRQAGQRGLFRHHRRHRLPGRRARRRQRGARCLTSSAGTGVFVTLAAISGLAALCAGALHLLNMRAVKLAYD